jgi:hypothetical protein
MRMRTRRVIAFLVVVFGLLALLGLYRAVFLPPGNSLEQVFPHIRNGMTVSQVTAIVGRNPDDSGGGGLWVTPEWGVWEKAFLADDMQRLQWFSEEAKLTVYFADGKATEAEIFRAQSNGKPSMLTRIRRWLALD